MYRLTLQGFNAYRNGLSRTKGVGTRQVFCKFFVY
jgi:hypothetical protein